MRPLAWGAGKAVLVAALACVLSSARVADAQATCPPGTGYNTNTRRCVACTGNTASPGGSTSSARCTACAAATVPNANKTACVAGCPAGQGLQPGTRANVCANCSVTGRVSSGGPNAQCTACGAGLIGAPNGTVCITACQPGNGLDVTTARCSPCNATSAAPGGSAACSLCSNGTLPNPSRSACVAGCPPAFGLAAGRNTGSQVCVPCSMSRQVSPGGYNVTCRACPAGQAPWTNSSICVPSCAPGSGLTPNFTCAVCPANTASAGNISVCAACLVNTVPNRTGGNASACVAGCPPGQGLSSGRCAACTGSTASAGGPGSVCAACPGGSAPSADRTLCIPSSCPGGTGFINNTCVPCGANSTSPGGATSLARCSLCKEGFTANTARTLCVPEACPPGTGYNNTTNACVACVGNTTSPGGSLVASACRACAPGTVANANRTQCVAPVPATCPAGTQLSGATCTPCVGNTVSGGGVPSAAVCTACPAGQVANANKTACLATSCAPGSALVSGACQPCTGNTTSAGGSASSCTPCPAGQVANANKTTCEASTLSCPAGSAFITGACSPCSNSTVSPGGNASVAVCRPCESGFAPNSDNSACVSSVTCPPGQEVAGSSCRACTSGSASPGGSRGIAVCAVCPPPSVPNIERSACVAAGAGDSALVEWCDAGSEYVAANNTCARCAAGFVSPGGPTSVSVCRACGSGLAPSSDRSSCITPFINALNADMLWQHNLMRARHPTTAPLEYNDTLARDAAAYVAKCIGVHDPAELERLDQGENLYTTTRASFNASERSFYGWYGQELPLYNFDSPGWVDGAGHFTQIVWRGTRSVGCAQIRCQSGISGGEAQYASTPSSLVACRYYPPGNVDTPGSFAANVIKPGDLLPPPPNNTFPRNASDLGWLTLGMSGTSTAQLGGSAAVQFSGNAFGFMLGAPAGGAFRWVGAAGRANSTGRLSARAIVLSSRDWWNDVGEVFHALGPLGNITSQAILWASGRFDYRHNTRIASTQLMTMSGAGFSQSVMCNIYNIFKSTRTIDGVKVSDTLVYNAVICPYCDDQCPSGQIGDVTPDQLQQSPSNFANLGQSAFVVPADANLTDAQVSAINTYLSKGNGIVVVGNADSWGGALDAMPVNRILARFGLRVTKTSGAETMGQADVYCLATPTAASLGALASCTAVGGVDPDVPADLQLVTGPQGTLVLDQDVIAINRNMPGNGYLTLYTDAVIGPGTGAGQPCTLQVTGTALPAAIALRDNGSPDSGAYQIAAAIGRNGTGRAVAWNSAEWFTKYTNINQYSLDTVGTVAVNSLWWAAGAWRRYGYRLAVLANSPFDTAAVTSGIAAAAFKHNSLVISGPNATSSGQTQYGITPAQLGAGATAAADVFLAPAAISWRREDILAIQAFAASGKGIVIAGSITGFAGAWNEFPSNTLLSGFGLTYLAGNALSDRLHFSTTGLGYVKTFSRRPNSVDFNPDDATAALIDYCNAVVNGTRPPANMLAPADSTIASLQKAAYVCTTALGLINLRTDPPLSTQAAVSWQSSDGALVDAMFNYAKVVYEDTGRCSTLNRNDTVVSLMLTYVGKLQNEAAPASVRRAPCANVFPGMGELVADGSAAVTVTVNAAYSTATWRPQPPSEIWVSTGLWAKAGTLVTVQLDAAFAAALQAAGRSVGIQIGMHAGDISTCAAHTLYCRYPYDNKLIRRYNSAKPLYINSALGGLIYVLIPQDLNLGLRTLTVTNATAAPYFRAGVTSVAQWRSSVRTLAAPWAELASDKIVLTVPAKAVRALDSPDAVLALYDSLMDNFADFAGIPRAREFPERFILDCSLGLIAPYPQDSVGGYPSYGGTEYHNYSDSTYSSGKAHLLSTGFPGTEEAQAKWLFVRALSTQHAWASWSPASMARPPHKGANILAAVYTLERTFGAPRGVVPEISSRARNQAVAALMAAKAGGKTVYPGGYADWNTWFYTSWAALLQLQENLFANQEQSWTYWRGRMRDWQRVPNVDSLGFFFADVSITANRNLAAFADAWAIPLNATTRAALAPLPAWNFDPTAPLA